MDSHNRKGIQRYGNRIMPRRLVCALLMMLWLYMSCACAESGRGSLDGRFDDGTEFEYKGKKYEVNSRVSTMLFICTCRQPETGEKQAVLSVIGVVDDDRETVTPLMIDRNTETEINDKVFTFAEAVRMAEEKEIDYETLLTGVNAWFPEPVIEHYFVLDIDGLSVLDEKAFVPASDDLEASAKQRLKDVYALYSGDGGSIPEYMSQLSEYINTNMKSGLLAKIVSKAEKYEHRHSVYPLYGNEANGTVMHRLDDAANMQLYIDLFYKKSFWQEEN